MKFLCHKGGQQPTMVKQLIRAPVSKPQPNNNFVWCTIEPSGTWGPCRGFGDST
ncbi:hypothetical protein DPMN_105047 [Dreissena polymorpha]|uniref:Uncharacterized protein n=1 Tax=Dreissena polymorpha TaxID=45954 RepID=A0A9D4HBL9_DREPO|nr:hypothetical protein DPMN_105047 [Dreissena polymorpha]